MYQRLGHGGQSSPQDTTLVTVFRWVPVILGALTVLFGFYLLNLPVPEDPEDFFWVTMQMERLNGWMESNRLFETLSRPVWQDF